VRVARKAAMIKSRPLFISLVCYGLLISSAYYVITSFSYLHDPDTQAAMEKVRIPYFIQIGMLYLNLIVTIVVAILMLEEVNWARWTYLGWGFVNIDYRLYIQTDWHDSVIVIATYLVSALILVLPSANEYFSSEIHYVDD